MVDTHTVARRIGFVPLPLGCVVFYCVDSYQCQLLRIIFQLLSQSPDLWLGIQLFMVAYLLCCILKIGIRMGLVRLSLAQYKETLWNYKGVRDHTTINIRKETPSKVPNRYAMTKGKIP